MKDPAFLFYTKDFQSGTQDMSCCELGAYLRLLMYQHQHGYVPKDVQRMMRITSIFNTDEFQIIWNIISIKFQSDPNNPNHLVNHKLNQVVDQRTKYQPKKIAAAVLAGLISSNKVLNFEQKEIIKKSFKINEFIDFSESELKEKVKEWFTKMVNQMVNYLANGNAIVNGIVDENENEVFDLKSENSEILKVVEKDKKSKVAVLPKFYDSLVEIVNEFNRVTKSKYEPNQSLFNNFEFWSNTYSTDQIISAIQNIPRSKWWSENGTPTILFRRRNPSGENVDHIGTLLNSREQTKIQQHSTQVTNAAISYLEKVMNE